jgi:indole-3-glycerol phosphate synthase
MNLLKEIFAHKRFEVHNQKSMIPQDVFIDGISKMYPPISLVEQIRRRRKPALIAEVKHKSPSKGILLNNFDPLLLARSYVKNGAAAISVLTDEKYFGGKLDYLLNIRKTFEDVPLLRKDFICDPYQVYQSRFYGADALLLIVSEMEISDLKRLYQLTISLGMVPLVEIHSEKDLEKALIMDPILIGVNNRDLTTFETDLQTTINLRSKIPDHIVVVSESGINTVDDLNLLRSYDIDAVLIGEGLVTSNSLDEKVRLFSGIIEIG